MEKLVKLREKADKVLDWIYKYRFIIAIAFIMIGVLFSLHGSSISLWNTVYNTGITDNGILFGNWRTIRSDEWAVTTPLIFSQFFNNFNVTTNIIRGISNTEVFSLYGLPVLNILEIFRPFHLGYLLLGFEKGLSFFWVARFISLFLVTFEFAMIITNKNKRLSLITAFMISLAPNVQWWFATNGVVEMFVFGQLALILLYKYMNTENLKSRILMLFFMMICAGGYIFILYPAYQIPMFYVFLFLAIFILIENRKNCKITKKDIISIAVMLLIFICLMVYAFIVAKETIITTLNTVYPGSRIENGGGAFRKYIDYLGNIFLPYKELGLKFPTVEEAAVFSLFPLGIITSIFYMIKTKKIDLFTTLLLVPYIVLGIFAFIGFPDWLAKLTFLSMSIAERVTLAIGFIDILLLVRYLSLPEKTMKLWKAGIVAIVLSAILVIITHLYNTAYIGIYSCALLFVMASSLFFFALEYNTKYGKYFFTLGIIGTMFIAGFTVNPIVKGTDMITDSKILAAVEKYNTEDEGLWMAEAIGFPGANYLVMAGAPTVNSTHAYPDLDFCRKLDPEGKYEKVYNRYSHIYIEVVEKEPKEKFVLISPDTYRVYITADELKTLGIKYIFTVRIMENYENENVSFDLLYDVDTYRIYKVNYDK